MRDIRIKSNGFDISGKHKALVEKWENFIYEFLDVFFIDYFYYDDKLVVALVKLMDGHYGSFNITENHIELSYFTCAHEEYLIFEKSTENSNFNKVM